MPMRSLTERLALSQHRDFTVDDEAAPALAHAKIGKIIETWRALRPAPGLLPARRLFDPAMVPDLLPNIWLLDVVPADARLFRFRLVGGAIVDAGTRFRKGGFMTDIGAPEEAALARTNLADQLASRRAHWRRGPSTLGHLEHIHQLERVILPMAADGQAVDLFLCLTVFYHSDGRVL